MENQTISMKKELESNVAIDKSLLNGIPITVGELLKALRGRVFKDDEIDYPVEITTTSPKSEPLTLIYVCSECNRVHLEAGYGTTYSLNTDDTIFIDRRESVGDYRDW